VANNIMIMMNSAGRNCDVSWTPRHYECHIVC
jgi:hypothetical protein